MRKLDIHGLRYKKVRGTKRKCRNMLNALIAHTSVFPAEEQADAGYWHMHLPVAEAFIDSYKTPKGVRHLCIQTLVDRVQYLRSIKPASAQAIRVVAGITLPCLWDSQLIVFFGDKYYSQFFQRNNEYQTWVLQENDKQLAARYHYTVPAGIVTRYYLEKISDDDYQFTNHLLFIGDLG